MSRAGGAAGEPPVRGADFRHWAEQGCRFYGEDSWFFIRELGQNSRDAGARRIDIGAGRSESGLETVSFLDDGIGMSREHARRFLFRLWASSKDGDRFAAGRYGIGFWTVLAFAPQELMIESACRAGRWAIALDANLEARERPCRLPPGHGTRVTLSRAAHFATAAEFQAEVRAAALRYLRFLRRNDRASTSLPVRVMGESIARPLRLETPGPQVTFRRRGLEGAVAFAAVPRVDLYARGLPVWRGTALEELDSRFTQARRGDRDSAVLAPVFLLNGNRLNVTVRRSAAVDDRELRRLRRAAERAREDLVLLYAHGAAGSRRQRRAAARAWLWQALFTPPWKLVSWLALPLLLLEILLLGRLYPPRTTAPAAVTPLRLADDAHRYAGPVFGPSRAAPLRLVYAPPQPRLFRLFAATEYRRDRGFVRAEAALRELPTAVAADSGPPLTVRLRPEDGGTLLLPVPSGYFPDMASLLVGGRRVTPVADVRSAAILFRAPAGLPVTYRCLPASDDGPEWGEAPPAALPAGVRFPPAWEVDADRLAAAPLAERAPAAERLVAARLTYDATVAPSAGTAGFAGGGGDWLQSVLQAGRGDCDVINGVLALLLRRTGVPARLAVGVAGRSGAVSPGLHAWAEYFDGMRWLPLDATAQATGVETVAGSDPVPSEPTAAPAAGGPGRSPPLTGRVAWALLAVALLLPLAVWVRGRRLREGARRGGGTPRRADVAQLALGSILDPLAWGGSTLLWNLPLLPCLGGAAPLSLRRAFRLGRRGRLSISSRTNPMAPFFFRRMAVLDGDDGDFAPLCALVPGLLNLDELLRLRDAVSMPGPADGPLAHANRLLRLIPWPGGPLLATSRLPGPGMLPLRLPFAVPGALPARFVAVDPEAGRWAEWSDLHARHPRLAVFRLLDELFAHTVPCPGERARLRRALARRLMRAEPC